MPADSCGIRRCAVSLTSDETTGGVSCTAALVAVGRVAELAAGSPRAVLVQERRRDDDSGHQYWP
jgi:hypothetical protein